MLTKRWFAPAIVTAIVIVFLLQLPAVFDLRPEFRTTLQLSIMFYLAAALPYNLAVWVVLRCFDIISGMHFRNSVNVTLAQDPRGLSLYLGCRLLAVGLGNAVVAGLVFASVRF